MALAIEPAPRPDQVMALIGQIQTDIRSVVDPHEAVHLVKRADAIKYLAKKAGAASEVQNEAAAVAVRARRRGGELLRDLEGFGAGKKDCTLQDLDLEATQSHRWQQLAKIPDDKFEAYLNETDEVTTAGALRVARAVEQREDNKRKGAVEPPSGKYRCIVIDPPWPIQKIEREVRPNQVVELDYPVMSLEEIGELPIPDLAVEDGCHVYLWVTHRFLPAGLDLFEQWGVKYQCVMTWAKNVGITPFSWMYDTEHVLFGRIGSLKLDQLGLRLSFQAPVTKHSEKPEVFYERVILASPGPRLEMFARKPRDGFTVWGNEVAGLAV